MEPSQLFCDLSRHPVTLVILMGPQYLFCDLSHPVVILELEAEEIKALPAENLNFINYMKAKVKK